MTNRIFRTLVLLSGLSVFPGSTKSDATAETLSTVDLALVLAIDCSYSVDDLEFRQQMDGLASAFRSQAVASAIASVPGGRIAVSLVQWSGPKSQALAIDWRILGNARDAARLAQTIGATGRIAREGATSIAAMIDAGAALLASFPGSAKRHAIDVSGDGVNNAGARLDEARARASLLGITVNGLAILNEVPALDRYFELHLMTGPGAFVVPAKDYGDYEQAILRKLLREIASPVS
jgi:hypothetical protein